MIDNSFFGKFSCFETGSVFCNTGKKIKKYIMFKLETEKFFRQNHFFDIDACLSCNASCVLYLSCQSSSLEQSCNLCFPQYVATCILSLTLLPSAVLFSGFGNWHTCSVGFQWQLLWILQMWALAVMLQIWLFCLLNWNILVLFSEVPMYLSCYR